MALKVQRKQWNAKQYVEAPSSCELIRNQSYMVDCPNAYIVQPEKANFIMNFGPNYHPTFEIRFSTNMDRVPLTVKDQENKDIWKHELHLTEYVGSMLKCVQRPQSQEEEPDEEQPSTSSSFINQPHLTSSSVVSSSNQLPSTSNSAFSLTKPTMSTKRSAPTKAPAVAPKRQTKMLTIPQEAGLVDLLKEGSGPTPSPEQKLELIRVEFIRRVSDSSLCDLLDKLLDKEVITQTEMESAQTLNRADKARQVFDTVRKKGAAASSVLIAALCEVDPCVSRQLKLM